jgi:hypothetical protein
MNGYTRYIVEVRERGGAGGSTEGNSLDFVAEKLRRQEHPYLFSKQEFTIDNLCYYMSFGQGRDQPSGPMQLPAFMEEIGISYRVKTW